MVRTRNAGIHFVRGSQILLGRKTYGKLKGQYTGFGGGVEHDDPSPRYTAVRELLEELYGLSNINPVIIANLMTKIDMRVVYERKDYTLYVARISELRSLNIEINKLFNVVPFFPGGVPTASIQKMIDMFKSNVSQQVEIDKINLFAFEYILKHPRLFDKYLLSDIQHLF